MVIITDPILIGPIGVGKTTTAELLAARLDVPQVSMDDLRWEYYNELGYDQDLAAQIEEREGFWGLYRYWKHFEAYAVERITSEHRDCVFDFGCPRGVVAHHAAKHQ
jgi:adenylate kinase family enzyme